MQMPNRKSNEGAYRYAFNGMETDMEVSGGGNSYTTQFRQYDPRLGRWKSLDPLAGKYPSMSPFTAFNNNPIFFVDPLGLEGTTKDDPGKNDDIKKGKRIGRRAANKKFGWNKRPKKGETVDVDIEGQQPLVYEYNGRIDGWQLKERDGGVLKTVEIVVDDIPNREEFEAEKANKKEEFETFPLPKESSNINHHSEPRALSNVDENGNFFMTGDSYDEQIHASLIGADYFIIEGDLLNDLKSSVIRDFYEPGQITSVFDVIVDDFLKSGKSYDSGQKTVGFGSKNKVDASTEIGTWIMRNAQLKYFIYYNKSGDIVIEVNAFDYFNVSSQKGKGKTYNSIGAVLGPLHIAAGANVNMQTRASWTVIIKR